MNIKEAMQILKTIEESIILIEQVDNVAYAGETAEDSDNPRSDSIEKPTSV